jgi:hypothetical protein
MTTDKPTFYEQVVGVNIDLPSLGLLSLMLRRMLLSTEFPLLFDPRVVGN